MPRYLALHDTTGQLSFAPAALPRTYGARLYQDTDGHYKLPSGTAHAIFRNGLRQCTEDYIATASTLQPTDSWDLTDIVLCDYDPPADT